MARFLFYGDACFKRVGDLSGGEKARLTFAKMLMSKSNLLILDEPTNHLDINSREALENALLEYDGTIIAVSHDRYFIDKLSTRLIIFGINSDNTLFDYKGGYNDFLEYKVKYLQQTTPETSSKVVQTTAKSDYLNKKAEQAEKRKHAAKIERSKKEMQTIEVRLSEIDTECDGNATDHQKLAVLYEEKENLEARLLEIYEFLENNSEDI